MKRCLTFILLLALAGCSTINEYGIGGEPRLLCAYRDGAPFIDDKLAGSDRVRGSVLRAFPDGASLCAAPKPAQASSAPK
jgi:hypothetical protein